MKDYNELLDKADELDARLSSPETLRDPALLASLMKEYRKLEPVAALCRERKKAEEALDNAKQLLTDPELGELAEEEMQSARKTIASLSAQIDEALHEEDESDSIPFVVEIRAGAGGEEAALFAASVYRMYAMYAQKNGWTTDPVTVNDTELGGYKEISFLVEGENAYRRFKYESGVHRVQRVPETESGGRIHTSTVTVAVLPEVSDVQVEIRPEDISIDTFRSSGAGGQHINKTESAIRITHKPTGLVVECQDERSQYKNKDKAMRVLRSRLLDLEKQKQQSAVASDRRSQVGTGDRSERIRTYNFPQSRVTDHRVNLTLYQLDAFLDGDMEPIVSALIAAENEEKFKETE